MPQYPREQLIELYHKLPPELQEALYSQQNASNIHDICTRNGVQDDNQIFDAAKNVGYVLLGLLPPDGLMPVLEKELAIDENVAKQISGEIHRFVFYPIKENIEIMYGIKLMPGAAPKLTASAPPQASAEETLPTAANNGSTEKRNGKGKDTYRELL